MADTIAVMNGGQDRAGGLGRPTSTSARRPRSWPTSSGSRTSSTRASRRATTATRRSRRTTAPRCTCRRTAATARTTCAWACGRRRSRSCPAGEAVPDGSQRPARQGRRRRVPGHLDPVRDPDRGGRGAQRVHAEHARARSRTRSASAATCSSRGARSTRSWSPVADPRTTRQFLGRAGSLLLASSLAGCGIEGTLERAQQGGHADPDDPPPEGADRQLDVLQLAALHRQEGPQDLRQALRRARQVRRGHQRQRRVLRQGPPAAAGRPVDRARHRRADRPDGGQVGAQPLRAAAGQEEHAQRRHTTSSTTSSRSRTTRSASSRSRGSRARSAWATTRRRPGAS